MQTYVEGYSRRIINGIESWSSPELDNIYQHYDTIWPSEENTDAWVMSVFNFKHGGTFIDAGAAGRSNSYNLEKNLNWRGVCIEPNIYGYTSLCEGGKFQTPRRNVINKCLYSHNGTVDFWELHGELVEETSVSTPSEHWNSEQISCIDKHVSPQFEKYMTKYGRLVKKECITLEKVILDYELPSTIDFLQLDIEHAEEEVFSVFPFSKYKFLLMCIEAGDEYYDLLTKNGYVLVENPFYPYSPCIDYYYAHESAFQLYPFKLKTL